MFLNNVVVWFVVILTARLASLRALRCVTARLGMRSAAARCGPWQMAAPSCRLW